MIDAANQSDVAVGYRYLTLGQTFIMVVLALLDWIGHESLLDLFLSKPLSRFHTSFVRVVI